MQTQEYASLLPMRVVSPGAPVAPITPAAAARAGLPSDAIVCGGTTDSIAAFVAAGVTEVGQAVTSLGSTMAVKLLSSCRVDDSAYGIYSHRLGE
jgi:sugar (pentulose or hexulose) kinase